MNVLHSLARPMLAGMFVYGGIDAVQHPETKVPKASKVAPPIADAAGVEASTSELVRFNGALQIAGGVALAAGVFPRLAALALGASLIPTTAAGHRFWEEKEPAARSQQTIHFLKNAAMLGGLLMVVSDGK
ncbi:MAG TPA: DoxX family protein [Acidimicrobiia bacterium]|jgi:uncharacterized membrane protein YphA (DoxX/SURF4 family)|nr:DoxX family protein [Acidimicrobiia bacterium]